MANEEYPHQSSAEIVERMLAHARTEDRAPHALRERIEADRRRAGRARHARRGWAARPLAPAVAGLVAVAAVIALVLPSGTPGAPSVSQAAAIALQGPVNPAPGPEAADPLRWLAVNVGELYFPNWTSALGWRALGQRRD